MNGGSWIHAFKAPCFIYFAMNEHRRCISRAGTNSPMLLMLLYRGILLGVTRTLENREWTNPSVSDELASTLLGDRVEDPIIASAVIFTLLTSLQQIFYCKGAMANDSDLETRLKEETYSLTVSLPTDNLAVRVTKFASHVLANAEGALKRSRID